MSVPHRRQHQKVRQGHRLGSSGSGCHSARPTARRFSVRSCARHWRRARWSSNKRSWTRWRSRDSTGRPTSRSRSVDWTGSSSRSGHRERSANLDTLQRERLPVQLLNASAYCLYCCPFALLREYCCASTAARVLLRVHCCACTAARALLRVDVRLGWISCGAGTSCLGRVCRRLRVAVHLWLL